MQTREWLRYFERNAREVLRPPAEDYQLTTAERRRIESSIQGFQLGEASEGKCLREGADAYARETGNTDYPQAIAYLIREENRHSAYLGGFMRQHGLPFAKAKWSDRVFRGLRRCAGIELSVRVLVTAELVALAYYDCLAQATGSQNLARICRRMLEEETQHIAFQMHHIHWMSLRRSAVAASAANVAHAVLTAGTLLVVWLEHGSVLRTKHGFRSFGARVWRDFTRAMRDGIRSAREVSVDDAACIPDGRLRHA